MSTVGGIDTRELFAFLFALLALERGAELVLSRRHVRRALARGGRLVSEPGVWPAMVGLHAAFLVVPAIEVVVLQRPFLPALAVPALVVGCAAMALRYWAIATLGDRWSTRVIAVPGEPAVVDGPYRWLRHPNYLAVGLELAALPLVHTAWLSAIGFSLANGWLLARRLRTEEALLAELADYDARLGSRRAFLPGGGS